MKRNEVVQFNALQNQRNINTQLENTCQELSNQAGRVFTETVALLKVLKSGTVAMDRLTVNDDGWDIMPELDEVPVQTRAQRRRDAKNGADSTPVPEEVGQGAG
jgi:hypothetical protein